MSDSKLEISVVLEAVDRMSAVIKKSVDASVKKYSDMSNSAATMGRNAAIGAAVVAAPLIFATKKAMDFEDQMADVAKTTGLAGQPLKQYGDALLQMSETTRTSITDLVKIGEIGGQLGIAEKDLLSFTKASNQFSIALASDYGGTEQAISQVGKIHSLFKDTVNLDVARSIIQTGSAINELGAVGSGTSANINDFVLRMGALPATLKSSFSTTAALGTFFEEAGIDAQIAAGGVSNFLLVASRNVGGFAQQMGISGQAASSLLKQDPTQFMATFAKSLNGLSSEQLSKRLHGLKINTQETIKTIGALGGNTSRLTELQKLSQNAFAKGNSLAAEAAKKNATAAAEMAKLRNQFNSASISLGQALLPVLTGLLNKITPIIKSFSDWTKENPGLASGLGITAGIIAGALVVVSGLSFAASGLFKAIQFGSAVMPLFTTSTLRAAAAWRAMDAATKANVIILAISLIAAGAFLIIDNWQKIKQFFINLWAKIKEMFWKAVAWIKEWGILFIGPVGFIIKYWDKIIAFFKAMPAKMKELGVNMIKGLIDGITFMIKKPLEMMSNLAKAISEKFKNLLGIASPSKVFLQMGRNVALGAAFGISAATPMAVNASANLATKIIKAPSTVKSSVGAKGGIGGRGATYNLNITVNAQGASPGVEADIRKMLDKYGPEFYRKMKEMAAKDKRTDFK